MFPEMAWHEDIYWKKRSRKKARKSIDFSKFARFIITYKWPINSDLYDINEEKNLINDCIRFGKITPIYQTGLDIDDFTRTWRHREKYKGILYYLEDEINAEFSF